MLTNGSHNLNKTIFHPKFMILHIFVSIWYIEKLLLAKKVLHTILIHMLRGLKNVL